MARPRRGASSPACSVGDRLAPVSSGAGRVRTGAKAHERRGWMEFLRDLRTICQQGDPAALCTAWREGREDRRIGPLVRAIELLWPVGEVLALAADLDRRIARDGLGGASRWLLDTWVPGWRAEVPPEAADVLGSAPVLIHGNHPSLLTAFLVAASARRPDLKIVSASILERLLPSYAPYSLPVVLPKGNWGEQLRRGGVPRLVVAGLIHCLDPDIPRAEAKERNRQALARAAAHIWSGGALLIAPAGWTSRRWPWYPGIGRIVQALSQDPVLDGDWLVPFREENSTDARVRAILRRGPVAALDQQRGRPVTIRYGSPTQRSSLAPFPEPVPEIVRLLQRRYETAFDRQPRT